MFQYLSIGSNTKFGWGSRARTYDILINSQTQLPTVLYPNNGAEYETRTRDPLLGRQMLYPTELIPQNTYSTGL